MFSWIDKAVLGMAILRVLSGLIEITVAMLMVKFNDVQKALAVNSLLALVGPTILVTTTAIGLIGMSDRLSFSKIFLILAGVALILYAIRK